MLADRAGVELPEMEYSEEARAAGRPEEPHFWRSTRKRRSIYYYQLRQNPRENRAMTYLKGRELS